MYGVVWCGVGVRSHSYLQYIVTDMRTLLRSHLTKPRCYFCPRNEAVETQVLKYRQYIMISFSHFKKVKMFIRPIRFIANVFLGNTTKF